MALDKSEPKQCMKEKHFLILLLLLLLTLKGILGQSRHLFHDKNIHFTLECHKRPTVYPNSLSE